MKSKISIIVGGSGQFGIHLNSYLSNKNHKILITTRNIKKANTKLKGNIYKSKIIKLDIYNKVEIIKLLKKYNPNYIFYFAGLSSPMKSFLTPKEAIKSNYIGCRNFLEVLKENKFKTKFLNASSCEVFGATSKKLNVKSFKKPISPYGVSKLMSYNLTKKFRDEYGIKAYNAIIFNTESIYRSKDYLIPKICLAAIRAYKIKAKTYFGNINISREWNWCEEQVEYIYKFINKSPQDFILSNGKLYSAKDMLYFAFKYFNLDYRKYTSVKKKFFRKKDFRVKRSNYLVCLKRNNLKRVPGIFGKKIIHKLIKNYINAN